MKLSARNKKEVEPICYSSVDQENTPTSVIAFPCGDDPVYLFAMVGQDRLLYEMTWSTGNLTKIRAEYPSPLSQDVKSA